MRKTKLAICISGRGSNMVALAEACQKEDYPAELTLILSNRANAGGLDYAKAHGIAHQVVDHKMYPDREHFEKALDQALQAADIKFVALAGFMRILTPWFVGRWQGRLINIHPSLLPKFKGLNTHARALEAGESQHGCSVHFVSTGVDEGDIIAQAALPILSNDDEDSLANRVLAEEHKLYPRALAKAIREWQTKTP